MPPIRRNKVRTEKLAKEREALFPDPLTLTNPLGDLLQFLTGRDLKEAQEIADKVEYMKQNVLEDERKAYEEYKKQPPSEVVTQGKR